MRHRWWTLVAVSAATFMLLLDVTIVTVALPQIGASLDAGLADMQWVIDGYALALAAALLAAGSAADLLGRRAVFCAGLAVFTVASIVCGLASTPLVLVLARVVQGGGGALALATSLALIAAAYQGRDRATAFGVLGAVTGAAIAAGPLVGGALTDWLGWQWIFLVNVPVGVATVVLTLVCVAESRSPYPARIDWAGAVLFAGALFALVFALLRGQDEGWGSPFIGSLLAASVVLLALFVLVELRVRAPLFDLALFRKPTFGAAAVAAFAISAGVFASLLYLAGYLQAGLGHSPLQAGLRLLPITLMAFVVAPVVGRFGTGASPRTFLAGGLLLIAAGLLAMRGLTATSSWTHLLLGSLAAGAGIGMVNPVLQSTAVAVVPPARSGMASGINNTFRQVGIATGIALLGTAFQARLTDRLGDVLGPLAASGGPAHAAAALPATDREAVAGAAATAYADAVNSLLLTSAVISIVAAVAVALLVRARDFSPAGPPAPAPVSAAAPS